MVSIAAVFAGLSTQNAGQPLLNHQAPQQISGRPLSGRTPVVGVPVHISRGTTNTVNTASGIAAQSDFALEVNH